MTKRKPSPRAARREAARAAEKLGQAREKLAALEAGGTAGRPVVVSSASQVEVHARAVRCLRCEGAMRVEEHRAESVDGRIVRPVHLRCPRCGAERTMFFRVEGVAVH